MAFNSAPADPDSHSPFTRVLFQNDDFVRICQDDIFNVDRRRKAAERYFEAYTGVNGAKDEKYYQGPELSPNSKGSRRSINSRKSTNALPRTSVSNEATSNSSSFPKAAKPFVRRSYEESSLFVNELFECVHKNVIEIDSCDANNLMDKNKSSKLGVLPVNSQGDKGEALNSVNFKESETLLRRAYLLKAVSLGHESEQVTQIKNNLIKCYLAQGKRSEANELEVNAIEHIKKLDEMNLFSNNVENSYPSMKTSKVLMKRSKSSVEIGKKKNLQYKAGKHERENPLKNDVKGAFEFEMTKKVNTDKRRGYTFQAYMRSLAEYPKWVEFRANINISCPSVVILGEPFVVTYSFRCTVKPERLHKTFDRIGIFYPDKTDNSCVKRHNKHESLAAWHGLIENENEGSLTFPGGSLQEPGNYLVKYLLHGSMSHSGLDTKIVAKHVTVQLEVENYAITCGESISVKYKYTFQQDVIHCKDDWIGLYLVGNEKPYLKQIKEGSNILKVKLPSANEGSLKLQNECIKALLPGKYELRVHDSRFGNHTIGVSKIITVKTSYELPRSCSSLGRSRNIRVFLCSPVADFKSERKTIRKYIFNTVGKYCDQKRISLSIVDLMDTPYVASSSKLKIFNQENQSYPCWNEIAVELLVYELMQCKSDIIYLFGDRYGLTLPQHCLDIIQQMLPWIPTYKSKLSNGISFSEILVAAGYFCPLSQEDDLGLVSFHYRHPVLFSTDKLLKASQFEPESRDSEIAIHALKATIAETKISIQKHFSSSKDVAQSVCSSLMHGIEKRFGEHVPDNLDMITLSCQAFAQHLFDRARNHICNKERSINFQKAISKYLYKLDRDLLPWRATDIYNIRQMESSEENSVSDNKDFIPARYASPLILVGETGCGKSTELVLWLQSFVNNSEKWNPTKKSPYFNSTWCTTTIMLEVNKKALLISSFIGITPELDTAEQILLRTMMESKRAFDLDDFIVPSSYEQVVDVFPHFLKRVKDVNGTLIMVIDNIDLMKTIDEDYNQLDFLWWLPEEIDPSVLMIIGTCYSGTKEYKRDISCRLSWNCMYIGGLDHPEPSSDEDIIPWTQAQQELYMCQCNPAPIKEMLKQIFDGIVFTYPGSRDVLRLIRCSYSGLTESELMDLTGIWESDDPMKRAEWSLVRKDLLEFLCYDIDGRLVIRNQMIASLVDESLLNNKYRKWIRMVISYFEATTKSGFSYRTAQEYPFLLVRIVDVFAANDDWKNSQKYLEKLEKYLLDDVRSFFSYWCRDTQKHHLFQFIKKLNKDFNAVVIRLLTAFEEEYGIQGTEDITISRLKSLDSSFQSDIGKASSPPLRNRGSVMVIGKQEPVQGTKRNSVIGGKRNSLLGRRNSLVGVSEQLSKSSPISSQQKRLSDVLIFQSLKANNFEGGNLVFQEFRIRCPLLLIQIALLYVDVNKLKEAQLAAECALFVCFQVKDWDELEEVTLKAERSRNHGKLFAVMARCLRCVVEILQIQLRHYKDENYISKNKFMTLMGVYINGYNYQKMGNESNSTSQEKNLMPRKVQRRGSITGRRGSIDFGRRKGSLIPQDKDKKRKSILQRSQKGNQPERRYKKMSLKKNSIIVKNKETSSSLKREGITSDTPNLMASLSSPAIQSNLRRSTTVTAPTRVRRKLSIGHGSFRRDTESHRMISTFVIIISSRIHVCKGLLSMLKSLLAENQSDLIRVNSIINEIKF